MSDAAAVSAPILVPLNDPNPTKETCHDPAIPIPAPRASGRRHFQRRLGRGAHGWRRRLRRAVQPAGGAAARDRPVPLVAYTALVGWLGTRASVPKPLLVLVVVGNAAWTLASIALLFSGAVNPNLSGELVVVAQAISTGVFAELQYIGMRRSGDTVAA